MENYVLAILRENKFDITYLYNNAAISFAELFECIVIQGEKPEYSSIIPRIQDTLKQMEIITLKLQMQMDYEKVIVEIENCKKNEFILVKVKPDFTKSKLFARGFRDDHYVFAKYNSGVFEIFNDIPEKIIKTTTDELADMYAGNYFLLSINRDFSQKDLQLLWNNRKDMPQHLEALSVSIDEFQSIEDIGIKLRNMLGVLKTTRYRLKEYYANYVNTEFLTAYLQLIERQYAIVEYYNLRKVNEIQKYFKLYKEVQKADIENMHMLCKKLEEI
ncbi:MAG: hypothetical protein Q8876_00850 [Bacillota bacterium]|nr:hypothetical protein [Bacillota bacterium]